MSNGSLNGRLRAYAGIGIIVAAMLCGIGCGELAQAMADAKQTESEIKKQIGVDSKVSVHDFDVRVTARLASAPTANRSDVEEKVTKLVLKTFHQRVERIDVLF